MGAESTYHGRPDGVVWALREEAWASKQEVWDALEDGGSSTSTMSMAAKTSYCGCCFGNAYCYEVAAVACQSYVLYT